MHIRDFRNFLKFFAYGNNRILNGTVRDDVRTRQTRNVTDLNSQLTQPHGGSVAMPYQHDACRTRTVKDILSFAKPKLT